ncbi:MAG TPA: glycoside hydrolase family 130 protein [Firmicutes bacterium]|nr:glycoside hydrolase family 130 protein [Bacillota bacterium]
MNYQSSPVIKKLSRPVLTYRDIPYKAALIFNAGVTKFNGKYVMVFRNDYGSMDEHKLEGTNIGLAYSDNGIDWKVEPKPCFVLHDDEIRRAYDPRLTVIDGRCYMCFAVDTNHGLRGGIAVTDDFDKFEILSLSAPDNRNMVLFPEKIGGYFCRLERPMPVYSRGRDRFDTWLSYSPDFKFWGESKLVLKVEDVPFANDKVGPGAPPVKTEKGWLATFHGVIRDESMGKNGWEASWKKKYYAGIMLLDLDDPSKIIGMSKEPLIATDQAYEVENGFRCDVIFPGGMLLEDSGEVKIYYGASDTYECMATADVNDLLKLCLD